MLVTEKITQFLLLFAVLINCYGTNEAKGNGLDSVLNDQANAGSYEEDSTILLSHDTFENIKPILEPITEKQFSKYLHNYEKKHLNNCHFNDLNLRQESHCDEICESFLVEMNSNNMMTLPCDYDAGILGISFAPNCNKLMVCSSYDGPDFNEYYMFRSEIYFFEIAGTDGLNSVRSSFKFSTEDWSIGDYVWIDNQTVGLKVYSSEPWVEGESLAYDYFELRLPQE